MSHTTVLAGLMLFVAGLELAQTDAPPTEFEVASVKPFVPPAPQGGRGVRKAGGRRGGPGTNDPGQVTWDGATLKALIMNAYSVKGYQVSGPEWLDTERYSIVAKVAPGVTKEQVLVMWQNLLASRFQVKLHRETKEIPIYEISVGKGTPKLTPTQRADTPPPPPPSGPVRFERGPDGCPIFPPGRAGTSIMMMPGRFQICAHAVTLDGLANMLTNQLSRPVIDKTGLAGEFDFHLEFEPEGQAGMMAPTPTGAIASAANSGPPPDGSAPQGMYLEPAPPIMTAFQKQLGLKLEAKKAPAEMLMIDKAEKVPTDN